MGIKSVFRKKSGKKTTRVYEAVVSNLEYLSQDAPFLSDAPAISTVANSDLATAQFQRDEIQIGKLLHEGAFTHSYEIIQLPQSEEEFRSGTNGQYDAYAARVSICSSGDLYTIKHISRKHAKASRQNKEADYLGETNLVLEAKYLSKLNHPNIVKLRGISMEEEEILAHESKHDAFFIITDMIVETLDARVVRWKEEDGVGINTKSPQFKKKMVATKGIASALQHLHERGIMLIALNPSNIGFLENGTVQLFDLSTCREVPPSTQKIKEAFEASFVSTLDDEEDSDEEDAYDPNQAATTNRRLMPTPEHGAVPRYYAPEVVTKGNYTRKADVYSWAMVVYQMLTLAVPFASMQPGQHLLKVCFEAKRPSLGTTGMPKNLQALLSRAWRHDTAERMSMNAVMKGLRSLQFDKKAPGGSSKKTMKDRSEKTDSSPTPRPSARRGGLERGASGVSTRRGMMQNVRAAKSMRGFGGRSSGMRREQSMRVGLSSSNTNTASNAKRDMAAGTMTPGRPQRPKVRLTRGMTSERNLMSIVATPKATKKKALQLRREASVRDF